MIATQDKDRVATVITDAGDRVTVRGALTSGLFAGISSVDRTFILGARYEFHPINSSDPYRDDACTATRQIAGPEQPPPDTQQPGNLTWPTIGIVVVILAAGTIMLLLRHRRTSRH